MTDRETQLENEKKEALAALDDVRTPEGLEAWRIAHLGKSSPVMQAFSDLGKLPAEERPLVGRAANMVKQALESAYAVKSEQLRQEELDRTLASERIDVTLPGRAVQRGRLHPLNQTLREVCQIFRDMGFQIYRSPEVETDDFNFTYLNMPPYHPARDMWDTFYTDKDGVLLRTHTSPGQIHIMRERAPEHIRAILPGTTMRYEQLTARSEIEFIQVEVLVIGKGITFADMKGTLTDFAARAFGKDAARVCAPLTSHLRNRALRWTWSALCVEERVAMCAKVPDGWRSLAVEWCTPRCSNTVDMTRKNFRALPLEWA